MTDTTNETQVEVTLKPCPFCGGSARIVKVWHPDTYAMRCLSCQAQGPNVKAGSAEDARPEAITAWNTRIQAEKRTAPRSAVEAPKPLPEGARGPFAVNCETGQWFYVNHGFTWQTMPSPIDAQPTDFQSRVAGWMLDCFTPEIAADKLERADRFCEEALELVQTMPDFTKDRAHALVDYVFSREVGERGQEVGGVMVTLAALCGPCDLDMTAEAEREYARISAPAVIEKIRAKHTSKPTGSALPIPQPSLTTDDALVDKRVTFIRAAAAIEHDVRLHDLTDDEIDRILRALEGEG